jgi:hypothetical protein
VIRRRKIALDVNVQKRFTCPCILKRRTGIAESDLSR